MAPKFFIIIIFFTGCNIQHLKLFWEWLFSIVAILQYFSSWSSPDEPGWYQPISRTDSCQNALGPCKPIKSRHCGGHGAEKKDEYQLVYNFYLSQREL